MLEGYKTKITAALTAIINLANMIGWVDLQPEVADQINAGLLGLVGLFLALKVDRWGKKNGRY